MGAVLHHATTTTFTEHYTNFHLMKFSLFTFIVVVWVCIWFNSNLTVLTRRTPANHCFYDEHQAVAFLFRFFLLPFHSTITYLVVVLAKVLSQSPPSDYYVITYTEITPFFKFFPFIPVLSWLRFGVNTQLFQ